ncbi:SUMF1/EgtB/PvdO family nonheme iron enzyme [Candidatus Bathyarchaeota archaeon]|nr:SUMF1/EgtB/PvdO family nonheme iron enzyme [Candidatus Bathyarchaeota archaeon]
MGYSPFGAIVFIPPAFRSPMDQICNSIGMKLVKIPAGTFHMGEFGTSRNEMPVHPVEISNEFMMAHTPVTNKQWEQFKPEAKQRRGEMGISEEDDSAVIFVSWHDAMAFCKWLSEKEGKTYRLPTEAEWEYACRAGTSSAYWTGESLPREHRRDNPDSRDINRSVSDDGSDPLVVKISPANPWGLHDMHGVVEEWCMDWFGPYELPARRTLEGSLVPVKDPIGRQPGHQGTWKVTRGGSYEALVKHLRSASRMAQHPDSKSRFIGFRVVQAKPVVSEPLNPSPPPGNAMNVNQSRWKWGNDGREDKPIWNKPRPFINPPPTLPNAREYHLYPHNHCPAITYCDNGDLLAAWFSCISEHDRDSFVILASRLVPGAKSWQSPSLFYKCPGRNMTGTALFNAGDGRLLHFNGNDEATSWNSMIMTMRESTDNGMTWSRARSIGSQHGFRNQVIACTRRLSNGKLVQLCDAVPSFHGGTATWISDDNGKSWHDPGVGKSYPSFKEGTTGAWIAGIHANVVETPKGLLAFGRGNYINERTPRSFSTDGGETWEYSASPFPTISGGQRLVLIRLEYSPGTPLALFSFTNPRRKDDEPLPEDGMEFKDASGETRKGFGLFSTLSFDHGATWKHQKLVSDSSGDIYPCMDYRMSFKMDGTHSEPSGYLAACQTPDGMIHLLSSALHYSFNLAWLKAPLE